MKAFAPLEAIEQSGNSKRLLTGFTLIELMVVIAIIAVLAAVITPQVFRQVAKGRVAAAIRFYNSVKAAATAYFLDIGSWPPGCGAGVGASCNTVSNANGTFINAPFPAGSNPGWNGPYLNRWPDTNPFGGGYGWWGEPNNYYCNGGQGGSECTPPVGERFLILGNPIPRAEAERIDLTIDGAIDGAAGLVRKCCPIAILWEDININNNVYILISRDGPVS